MKRNSMKQKQVKRSEVTVKPDPKETRLAYWQWMRDTYNQEGGYWARSEFTGRHRKKGEQV